MSLSELPESADNIIAFDGESSVAATLNYNVPLPGRLRNRRIIELKGVASKDQFNSSSRKPIIDPEDAGYDSNSRSVRESLALEFYTRAARAAGIRSDVIQQFRKDQISQLSGTVVHRTASSGSIPRSATSTNAERIKPLVNVDIVQGAELLRNGYLEFINQLKEGVISLPMANANGQLSGNSQVSYGDASPKFFIIEYYEISSFLGDYGLGKTVRTYSLFPGERVTIRLRTWRSSEEKRSSASTIFDSFDEEVNERFGGEVRSETSDRQTENKDEGWHADAKAGVSWGVASAEVSAGGSGQYQSGREEFASSLNQATQEHAKSASAKRDNTVTSSTENTNRTENEESIEREIKNVNLRRVLNFVFRELNQEYLTKIALVDVRVGFSNGTPGSWRESPISQLRPMLSEVLKASEVDAIAQKILGLVGTVFDHEDQPYTVLEKVEFKPQGDNYATPPTVALRSSNGKFAPPTDSLIYRFRRGPIGVSYPEDHEFSDPVEERHAKFKVPGVVVWQDAIVLRTDSLVVEALLGQADALDDYAMTSQKADADAKALANTRTQLLNDALLNIAGGKDRLTAFSSIVRQENSLRVQLNGEAEG